MVVNCVGLFKRKIMLLGILSLLNKELKKKLTI